ncbi:hypothetical protein NPIL_349211 [Nephila pilipes]|uniref:Uncharacterized protein n=1 Tax=Nephila pilipes TaxID=299642 RepID=A0A8X6QW65_NEPPI|nr:hypothetical protein NPIL_349211 [Nephila pilipes]
MVIWLMPYLPQEAKLLWLKEISSRVKEINSGLVTGGHANVVHQHVLCAVEEALFEDVLLTPNVLEKLVGPWNDNLFARSSQNLSLSS